MPSQHAPPFCASPALVYVIALSCVAVVPEIVYFLKEFEPFETYKFVPSENHAFPVVQPVPETVIVVTPDKSARE